MVAVLSKDGIRAIKNPTFETVSESIEEMRDNEQVLGTVTYARGTPSE